MSAISQQPVRGPFTEKAEEIFRDSFALFEYGPERYVMSSEFNDICHQVLDFEVRKDDVWMISFPRTGSTWCQEMVWLIGNDLNFEKARSFIQQVRAPLLELSSIFVGKEYNEYMGNYGNSVERAKNNPPPRFIKSHLPYSLLPRQLSTVKPKLVYVARNPKDVCISYFYHIQEFYGVTCNLDDICDLMLGDKLLFCPVWSHYLEFWSRRHSENILFLKYEEMQHDLKAVIRRTAAFLEKPLSEEEVASLSDYLSFNNMKSNKAVNMEPVLNNRTGKSKTNPTDFIRNGKIGDWKNHMTEEMSRKFDLWIEEHSKKSGLYF